MPLTFTTVNDAIRETAQLMSLINGENMTPYSDQLILSLLVQANQKVIAENTWSDCTLTYIRTLDGVTGQTTAGIPIAEVDDAKKIHTLYHDSSNKPVARLSGYINPSIATWGFGYQLINKTQDPIVTGTRKFIQWYPLTLTGNVMYKATAMFDLTTRTNDIPIDFWSHVYWAAWLYANMDGTNPAQMEAFKVNYNDSIQAAIDMENERKTTLDPWMATPDQWVESDDPYWMSGG